ncbi:MAG TPA: methyltransferase [Bacteroidales bacterium]|nr:methyltransferase [Bacteroidales bacterium]
MEFLIFFVACFIVILSGYSVFRIIVRRDYKKKGRLNWTTTTLQVIVFFLHGNLAYFFLPVKWLHIPPVSINGPLKVFALSLLCVSLIFLIVSMCSLGYLKLMGVKLNELKISGIYRLSRNPQVVFYCLLLVGFAALWPSWYTIPWILVYLALAHMMVITEEENLKKVFGKSYEDYRSKVPRYFSFFRLF